MKALLIAVTISIAAFAQDLFHAHSRLVELSVSVTRAENGKPMDGLTPEDFVVRDNGKLRSITSFFQRDRLPLKIILLVETSASQLAEVDSVADNFPKAVGLLHPDDQLGLAQVFPGYKILLKPTTERSTFSAALRQLKASLDSKARTDFEDLNRALVDISRTETDASTQLVIVLASNDFDLLNSETSAAAARTLASNRTIVATFIDLQNRGVSIAKNNVHAMRMVTPMRFFVRDCAASYFAEQTGGPIVNVREGDYRAAMENLLASLSRTYLLGFVPPEGELDGKYHKLSVTLKTKAGVGKVKALHREGYWANR